MAASNTRFTQNSLGQSKNPIDSDHGIFWQILLKKSLMISGSSDSVAVMRFAVEAGDDGAARSRSRAAVLFILS